MIKIRTFFIKRMKKIVESGKNFFIKKIDKAINKFIESFFSPQVLSIFIISFLSYCFNKDIVDTITNTQARMLLQKTK